MIEQLIAGADDPEVLAELAQGRLRKKMDLLRRALVGGFDSSHGFMARQLLDSIDQLDARIAALDRRIDQMMEPFASQRDLLCTIPGLAKRTAEVIVAEVGVDMSQFPSPGHLASWAKLCPGNNASAGKRKSGRNPGGNPWLRGALTQAAMAAARTKDTYLAAQFWHLARTAGKNKAAVGVAHSILVAAWHMLSSNSEYQDLGPDWFSRTHDPDVRARRLVAQLEALGHTVTLTPIG